MGFNFRKQATFSQTTRDWLLDLYKDKEPDYIFKSLEIKERQKYNYYIDCSERFTTEQDKEYNAAWDEIIDMIQEMKAAGYTA